MNSIRGAMLAVGLLMCILHIEGITGDDGPALEGCVESGSEAEGSDEGCICKPGYGGARCDIDVCLQCTLMSADSSTNVNGCNRKTLACTCKDGFEGTFCEKAKKKKTATATHTKPPPPQAELITETTTSTTATTKNTATTTTTTTPTTTTTTTPTTTATTPTTTTAAATTTTIAAPTTTPTTTTTAATTTTTTTTAPPTQSKSTSETITSATDCIEDGLGPKANCFHGICFEERCVCKHDFHGDRCNIAKTEDTTTQTSTTPSTTKSEPATKTTTLATTEATTSTTDGSGSSFSSYIPAYILVAAVLAIIGYILYHNKQKILGLVGDVKKGPKESRSRTTRPSSKDYARLEENVSDSMPIGDSKPYIY